MTRIEDNNFVYYFKLDQKSLNKKYGKDFSKLIYADIIYWKEKKTIYRCNVDLLEILDFYTNNH